MPTQKTDWKKIRSAMQDANDRDVPGPGDPKKGVTLLEKGARQSLRNDLGSKATSMDVLMRIWQENQQARARNIKNKKRPPLKGLFGGGE